MRIAIRTLLLAGVAAALAACSHQVQPDESTGGPQAPTTVTVENQGFTDMTIYVVSSGARMRLGLAVGNTTTKFRIPDYLVGGLTPLRFLADPVGGTRAPVSDEMTVSPGENVHLTITPD